MDSRLLGEKVCLGCSGYVEFAPEKWTGHLIVTVVATCAEVALPIQLSLGNEVLQSLLLVVDLLLSLKSAETVLLLKNNL